MKINSSYFYIGLAVILILLTAGTAISYFSVKIISNKDYLCTTVNQGACGYKGKNTDKITALLVGKLTAKTDTKNNLKLVVTFPFGKDQIMEESFLLPTKIKMGLNSYRNVDNTRSIQSDSYFASEIVQKLSVGSSIGVILRVSDDKELQEAKRIVGNEKYIDCMEVNKAFINFLEKPNPLTRLTYSSLRLYKQCDPVTLSLIKYN